MARKTKRITVKKIWGEGPWTVRFGRIVSGSGQLKGVPPLFRVLGEKLPLEALTKVENHLKRVGIRANGVYVALDSMGYARYIGRGGIFPRLRARLKSQKWALKYFSFYVVKEGKHEREIETLLIRTASPLLEFNSNKKKANIDTGGFLDYETGTEFFERRYKRGKREK